MILCLNCKRLWPRGTRWCGHCRATLGKRICDKGHESPLWASSCTICGSRKLTPAVSSLNLRPALSIVVLLAGWYALPLAVAMLNLLIQGVFSSIFARMLPTFIVLLLLGWALGHILGKKLTKIVHELLEEILKLTFKIAKLLIKSLIKSLGHGETGKELHERRHD